MMITRIQSDVDYKNKGVKNTMTRIYIDYKNKEVKNTMTRIYIAARNMGFEPDGMSQVQMNEMSVAFNLPK